MFGFKKKNRKNNIYNITDIRVNSCFSDDGNDDGVPWGLEVIGKVNNQELSSYYGYSLAKNKKGAISLFKKDVSQFLDNSNCKYVNRAVKNKFKRNIDVPIHIREMKSNYKSFKDFKAYFKDVENRFDIINRDKYDKRFDIE